MENIIAYIALVVSLLALAVAVMAMRKNKKVIQYRPDTKTMEVLKNIEKEIESLKEVVQVKSR